MKIVIVGLLLAASLYAVAPTTVSVSPSSGSGASQTFTWIASDADGGTDLTTLYALINPGASSTNGCYVIVARATNTMTLVDGAGGSMTPGSAATDEHTYCKLFMAGSSITTGTNQVTAVIQLTFKSPFAGAKNLWLAAQDVAGPATVFQ
jgi:hypothetical protein